MSKIIITGGLGFLGQHIVKEVATYNPNKNIIVLARTEKDFWVFDKVPKHIKLKTGINLENPNSYKRHVGKGDIVIHNAGLVSYKKSDKKKIYDSNVESTKNILKISNVKKIKKLVMISSISTVGLNKGMGKEHIFPQPENIFHEHYAHSKLISELELKKYKKNLDYLILNPSVIIGPGAPYMRRFFNILTKVSVVPVVSVKNSFVDARDVAKAVVLAMKSKLKHQRFIITTHNITTEELISRASEVLKSKKMLIKIPDNLFHIADSLSHLAEKLGLYPFSKKPKSLLQDKSYSAVKAKQMLRWKPKYTLEQTLSDTLKWINT